MHIRRHVSFSFIFGAGQKPGATSVAAMQCFLRYLPSQLAHVEVTYSIRAAASKHPLSTCGWHADAARCPFRGNEARGDWDKLDFTMSLGS